MRTHNMIVFVVMIVSLAAITPARLRAAPVVPGHIIQTYASWDDPAANPTELAFDPSGILYVGRNIPGTNEPPIRILRFDVGGTPVPNQPVQLYEYGIDSITDPDAVIVDVVGTFSGTPGSVLVGGSVGANNQGFVSMILPDQTVSFLWGPTTVFRNPTRMAIDSTGRLLFVDPTARRVMASTGGAPQVLVPSAGAVFGIAVDGQDRFFVSIPGTIRLYDADGSLLDGAFASVQVAALPALAIGPGGTWGTDLYVVSSGQLIRFGADPNSPSYGSSAIMGTGLDSPQVVDIAFGPDGALYAAANDDSVVRIVADCNGNGVADAQDIVGGTSLDCNANGIPDECEQDFDADGLIDDCDPDVDNDGLPNAADVCPFTPVGVVVDCEGRPRLDLNGDCAANGADLSLIVQQLLNQ